MEHFVKKFFPEFAAAYMSFEHPCHVMRADLFRYLVLYKFGGVYMDLDGKCVKSFDQWWTFPRNQRVDQK